MPDKEIERILKSYLNNLTKTSKCHKIKIEIDYNIDGKNFEHIEIYKIEKTKL